MKRFAAEPDSPITEELTNDINHVFSLYEKYREDVKNGLLGYTAQFWIIYLNLLRVQHCIHTAVQENDFDLRLFGWEYFVPYYFAFNKMNYARYGSYYLEMMKSIDTLYPGLKNMLTEKGLSAQAQNKYPLRTAIDQRGEQTINRDAKVAGGVKYFSTREESVLKWCLNRSDQAENTKALKDLCGIGADPGIYKPVRPSQIAKSEDLVNRVVNVLTDDYINPFGINIEKDSLVSLSSGMAVSEDISEYLLSLPDFGKEQSSNFIKSRIQQKEIPFHDPIKRNHTKGFNLKNKKTRMKNKKSVDVNRDILARLLYISTKKGKTIDFEKALRYPLSEVPLSICSADGSIRKTNKSKLAKLLLSRIGDNTSPDITKGSTIYIIDLMALLRTMTNIPETFEDLAMQLLSFIPKGYLRVDFVADSYFPNSIKDAERTKRGVSSKIIIKSARSKIPRDFTSFLSSGENKTRMIELIFETLKQKKAQALNTLRTTKIVLSRERECSIVTLAGCSSFHQLLSNQEEADTKVITHALQAQGEDQYHHVIIRSPSGDTDILVLAVSLLHEFCDQVTIDNGAGKNRKLIWLGGLDLTPNRCSSLIGFHAFTGNDYISSFFKRGKDQCWKLMEKFQKFETCFKQLGLAIDLNMDVFSQLEEYVCYLYGIRTL